MMRGRRCLLLVVSLCCLTGCGARYSRQALPAGPAASPSPSAAPTPSPEKTADPVPETVASTQTPVPVPDPPELTVTLTPPEAGEVWGTRALLVEYRDVEGNLLFEGDLSLPYAPEAEGGLLAVEEYCRKWMEANLGRAETGMDTARTLAQQGHIPICDLYFHGGISFSRGDLALLTAYEEGYLGGAHGFHHSYSTWFDLSTGAELTLADLFSDWEDARAAIWTELEPQVKEYEPAHEGISQRADEGLENAAFFLEEDGLTIHYNEYAIAAYAFGSFEFFVPKEALSGLTAYPIWD